MLASSFSFPNPGANPGLAHLGAGTSVPLGSTSSSTSRPRVPVTSYEGLSHPQLPDYCIISACMSLLSPLPGFCLHATPWGGPPLAPLGTPRGSLSGTEWERLQAGCPPTFCHQLVGTRRVVR